MKNIYIYSGKGAYQAKDIENFLSVFDFKYERACEHDIGLLSGNEGQKIFIVPGGKIRDYLPSWGKRGIEAIRNFVKKGGIYIGICAGSYVAGKKFRGDKGLEFYNDEIPHIKYQGIIKAKNKSGKVIELIAENGPDFSRIKEGKILFIDFCGNAQILQIKFGKGQVLLFSSHPEGSVYYSKHPKKFSGAKYFTSLLKKI